MNIIKIEQFMYLLYISGGRMSLQNLLKRMDFDETDAIAFQKEMRADLARLQGRGYITTQMLDDLSDSVVELTAKGTALAEAAAEIRADRMLDDWNSRCVAQSSMGY